MPDRLPSSSASAPTFRNVLTARVPLGKSRNPSPTRKVRLVSARPTGVRGMLVSLTSLLCRARCQGVSWSASAARLRVKELEPGASQRVAHLRGGRDVRQSAPDHDFALDAPVLRVLRSVSPGEEPAVASEEQAGGAAVAMTPTRPRRLPSGVVARTGESGRTKAPRPRSRSRRVGAGRQSRRYGQEATGRNRALSHGRVNYRPRFRLLHPAAGAVARHPRVLFGVKF